MENENTIAFVSKSAPNAGFEYHLQALRAHSMAQKAIPRSPFKSEAEAKLS